MNAVRSSNHHDRVRRSIGGAKTAGGGGDGGGAGHPSSSSSQVDFYSDVPNFELTLDEFEEYALARLKVLRKIEELKTRNITGNKYNDELDATVKKNLYADADAGVKSEREKRRARIDRASHFILRAAYCRTEDLRRWFLAQECALFRHRLDRLADDPAAFRRFLAHADDRFNFDRVGEDEKEERRDALMSCPPGGQGASSAETFSPAAFSKMVFYRIPFVQALDLVKLRQVYVEGGFAYVPTTRLVTIVTARFRMNLSKSLVHASAAFAHVAESTRIGPLLSSMNQQYTGRDYASEGMDGGTVTSQNVDDLAMQSMPLCMRQLHVGLKDDHKLKHWGRLQYGLFLKGAGMSMEESLIFFQREFTKIMTSEQFQKQYAYNIRHMYGKEGKRASYTAYNCMKIVMGNPPQSGDHHGCPFRHYDENHLSSVLSKMNINGGDKRSILDLKKSKNYQLACQKHFEVMHPGVLSVPGIDLDGVGNHPNAWFQASTSYHSHKNGNDSGTSSGSPAKQTEKLSAKVTPQKND